MFYSEIYKRNEAGTLIIQIDWTEKNNSYRIRKSRGKIEIRLIENKYPQIDILEKRKNNAKENNLSILFQLYRNGFIDVPE